MHIITYGFSDAYEGWKEILGHVPSKDVASMTFNVEEANKKIQKKFGSSYFLRIEELNNVGSFSKDLLFSEFKSKSGF